jgi:hypothetical protein
MGFTQKVAVLDASQNLSTSPWTVSGLKGDSFDYAFMIFLDSSNSTDTNTLRVRFNSDSGANYNGNNMRGNGTTTAQADTTGSSSAYLGRMIPNTSSRNSFAIGTIKGDSSQNRTLTAIHSNGEPRIYQDFCEWTNNVDELTSITFDTASNASYKFHIVVWEVPKLNNNDNWELVDSLSWSASATEQSITGLAGDTDLFYKILWDGDDTNFLGMEINNDAGANYDAMRLRNSGTAFIAVNNTNQNNWAIGKQQQAILNAETGDERTGFMMGGPQSADKQMIRALWYSNTATEVTSLYFTPDSNTTSELKLFRAKYPASCVPDMFDLPFQKVDSFSVNTADFTAGQSFSGLDGDNVLLYRLEWLGSQDTLMEFRTNGDSGASDYAFQDLRGKGTAEGASSDTSRDALYLPWDSNNKMSIGVAYIFPQSGEYRPVVSYAIADEDQIKLEAGWRLDTVTEITSIQVLGGSTGNVNGIFTLSEIRL